MGVIMTRHWNRGMYLLLALLFTALLAWGCTATPVSSQPDALQYQYFCTDWTQRLGDELIPLEDIHKFHPVDVGEPLEFICTLPEIYDWEIFLLFVENQEFQCYVDGELLHQFVMDEGFSRLKTPGSAWVQVDLDRSMSGKTCTFTFTSHTEQYNNQLNDIYFMDSDDVNTLRLSQWWFHGAVVAALCTIFTISHLNGILWKQKQRKKYWFSLSRLCFCVMLWVLTELGLFDLLFARPVLSYMLGIFFFGLIPLALIYLAKNSTNRYHHPHIVKGIEVLALANIILPWILLFIFDISLIEMESYSHLVFFVVIVVLFMVSLEKVICYKKMEREEYPCLPLVIPLLGGGIDIIAVALNMEDAYLYGLWTIIGFVIYTSIVFVVFIKLDSRYEQEKMELAKSYQKLQNTSLVKQIQAHFIFNVLNTISALCKRDVKLADYAIRMFAAYLRDYLVLVNQQEKIAVQRELDMVKNYLSMEKIRFGDELDYQFDIQYSNFDVPPLSIQTLVENAIVHGLRGKQEGGEIVVRTRRVGEFAQVEIIDTGAGFDTSVPPNETSVGLANVKKRVYIMCEGTISIESTIGVGTKVTMTIPLLD